MVKRSSSAKPQAPRPLSRAGHQPGVGAAVMAREEDVKAFNALVREKKRLHERLAEQSTLLDRPDTTALELHNIQPATTLPANPIFQQRCADNTININSHHAPVTNTPVLHFQIRVEADQPAFTEQRIDPVVTESVVAVIERLIVKEDENKQSRQWVLELLLDDEKSIDIKLEYHGKGEWKLGLEQHNGDTKSADSGHNGSTDPATLDRLYVSIESGLKLAQPGLRLSEIQPQSY